jgi:hypothetical protein
LKYTIKAIPTTYAGVNFRSRLEARWAAFFDLCGWVWDYEPFDLDGWAPDFRISLNVGSVLVEVKPADIEALSIDDLAIYYDKAARHAFNSKVLLLGLAPMTTGAGLAIGWPEPCDDLLAALRVVNATAKWREAGNAVQWQPPRDDQVDIKAMLDRVRRQHKASALVWRAA